MANLNFQQPPRSIIGRRASMDAAFSGTINSVHSVTPTSGMFQSNNVQRNNLFTPPRNLNEQKQSQNLGQMISSGSFMPSRGYVGQNINSGLNFHSVFGNNDTGTPPLLDPSEFPSLTNARGNDSMPQLNTRQTCDSKPYVGMIKQPTAEPSKFHISSKDFPALPGTQPNDLTQSPSQQSNFNQSTIVSNANSPGGGLVCSNGSRELDVKSHQHVAQDKEFERGIQISPDGMVTNIPSSMVNNEFGMVGLLSYIRAAESDPTLLQQSMGRDLTSLGLNLSTQANIYPSFGGPFSDQPARPQDIDFPVIPEYLVNAKIRDKLHTFHLKKYKDQTLFFLFYTNVGDLMQMAAAAELHNREWRYHTVEKVWMSRVPGLISHYQKNGHIERGVFYYFDTQLFRAVAKDFQIDSSKFESCPNLNAYFNGLPSKMF